MSNLTPIQNSFPTSQEFSTMKELGNMAIRSGLLPQSIKTPEQAVIIMLKGRELGIPPMQAFSSIAVVNGKPTMSAELMLSMIFRNVPGATVNFIKTDDKECVIEAKRPNGTPTKFSFNIEDAKRAGLFDKGPWKSYPAAMLRARCISALARAMFPDALSGVVYTPEELGAPVDGDGQIVSTTPEAKDVTPPPTEPPQRSQIPGNPEKPVTMPQLKRLMAISNQRNWKHEEVSRLIEKLFSIQSSKELNMGQYDELVKFIEGHSPESLKMLTTEEQEFLDSPEPSFGDQQ